MPMQTSNNTPASKQQQPASASMPGPAGKKLSVQLERIGKYIRDSATALSLDNSFEWDEYENKLWSNSPLIGLGPDVRVRQISSGGKEKVIDWPAIVTAAYCDRVLVIKNQGFPPINARVHQLFLLGAAKPQEELVVFIDSKRLFFLRTCMIASFFCNDDKDQPLPRKDPKEYLSMDKTKYKPCSLGLSKTLLSSPPPQVVPYAEPIFLAKLSDRMITTTTPAMGLAMSINKALAEWTMKEEEHVKELSVPMATVDETFAFYSVTPAPVPAILAPENPKRAISQWSPDNMIADFKKFKPMPLILTESPGPTRKPIDSTGRVLGYRSDPRLSCPMVIDLTGDD